MSTHISPGVSELFCVTSLFLRIISVSDVARVHWRIKLFSAEVGKRGRFEVGGGRGK